MLLTVLKDNRSQDVFVSCAPIDECSVYMSVNFAGRAYRSQWRHERAAQQITAKLVLLRRGKLTIGSRLVVGLLLSVLQILVGKFAGCELTRRQRPPRTNKEQMVRCVFVTQNLAFFSPLYGGDAGCGGAAGAKRALVDPGDHEVCPAWMPKTRDQQIAELRESIRKLEAHPPLSGDDADHAALTVVGSRSRATQPWTFGAPAIDRLLPKGLGLNAVHEIKGEIEGTALKAGASAPCWMTALGFAIRLAVRRIDLLSSAKPWIMWCWPRALAGEFGHPSGMGLVHLGLDPSRLLIVETPRAADALNALEEGLKSQTLGLAFGVFDDVDLTPARRLSLAAGASHTPCLIITHPASAAAAATATRWRVASAASAPHAFDARAPGAVRFMAGLERCRVRPESAATSPMFLEWCDETRRFSLAAGMADHAAHAGRTAISPSRYALRVG